METELAAANATIEDASEWVAELVEGCIGERPQNMAAGLDSLGELLKLGRWLHAEAVWRLHEDVRVIAEDRDVASAQLWNRFVHEQNLRREETVEVDRLRREVEFEANGTNPSIDPTATVLEGLAADFHERAHRRAEAGGDSPQCDGDCGNDDCHMTSAVAAWQMAAAAVQRRIAELAVSLSVSPEEKP